MDKSKLYRVILIDDNDADNFYNKLILEEAKVAKEIIEFTYAEEALNFLKAENNKKIDIIFLDINMPRMNGFEFLEEYNQLAKSNQANSVVIMLTSSGLSVDKEKSKSYPCVSDFISKPLTKEVLLRIIKNI